MNITLSDYIRSLTITALSNKDTTAIISILDVKIQDICLTSLNEQASILRSLNVLKAALLYLSDQEDAIIKIEKLSKSLKPQNSLKKLSPGGINLSFTKFLLLDAVRNNNEEFFDSLDKSALLSHFRQTPPGEATVLYIAAEKGKMKILQKILSCFEEQEEKCTYIMQPAHHKQTPLFAAALYDHADVISCLLNELDERQAHAYRQQRNNRGMTPIHIAASQGNISALHALLKDLDAIDCFYHLNSKDHQLNTPLVVTSGLGQTITAQKILRYFDNIPLLAEAYLFQQRVDGAAAIHLAVHKNDEEMLSTLLNSFKDNEALAKYLQLKDYFGKSAFEPLGKFITEICQARLIKQVIRYLLLRGDITKESLLLGTKDTMPSCFKWNEKEKIWKIPGLCAGLLFRHSYYSAKLKKNEFYQELALISNWDRTRASLLRPLDICLPYSNLNDLMHQWIHQVFWFQQHDPSLESLSDQNDLVSRFEVAKQEGESLKRDSRQLHVDKESLPELFELLFSCYLGEVKLAAVDHGISVTFLEGGLMSYYNSNYILQMVPISYQLLSSHFLYSCCPYDTHNCVEIQVDFLSFSGKGFKTSSFTRPSEELLYDKSLEGWTPLHKAMLLPDISLAQELILDSRRGNDLTTLDNKGNTPLHFASSQEKVQLLLEPRTPFERQCLLQHKNIRGHTPFIKAILDLRSDVASALLGYAQGKHLMAIKSAQSLSGKSPLSLAVGLSHPQAIKFTDIIFKGTTSRERLILLQDRDTDDSTPLHHAATNPELIVHLLRGLTRDEISHCLSIKNIEKITPNQILSRTLTKQNRKQEFINKLLNK